MTWFAHFAGGPLDGEVEVVDSFSPYSVTSTNGSCALYRLVRWVPGEEAVEPFTPLLYVWEGLPDHEFRRAARDFDDGKPSWSCSGPRSSATTQHGFAR